MAVNTARRLNDAQLRDQQLLLANPLELEGICHDRPDTKFPPVIMGEYYLQADKPEVRCCLCPQRTPHRKGFVVQFSPQTLHLIGSTCGPTHLNLQFGVAKRSHSELVNRQRYIRHLDDVSGRLSELLGACNRVLFSPELKAIEAKGVELSKAAGDAVFRLRALMNSGRPLTEEVRVRDLAAEARRDERLSDADNRERPPIYRREEVAIGQLAGGAVLMGDLSRERVFAFKCTLAGVKSVASKTDEIATSKLRAILKGLEEGFDAANQTIADLNAAHRFFGKEHLELLVRWAGGHSSARLLVDGRNLVVESLDGRTLQVITPLSAAGLEPLPELYTAGGEAFGSG